MRRCVYFIFLISFTFSCSGDGMQFCCLNDFIVLIKGEEGDGYVKVRAVRAVSPIDSFCPICEMGKTQLYLSEDEVNYIVLKDNFKLETTYFVSDLVNDQPYYFRTKYYLEGDDTIYWSNIKTLIPRA